MIVTWFLVCVAAGFGCGFYAGWRICTECLLQIIEEEYSKDDDSQKYNK